MAECDVRFDADADFPTCLSNERLTANNLTAKFLWMLNTCFSTSSNFGVQRYFYIFDVVDLHEMKARQFFAYLDPSRRRGEQSAVVWQKTKIIFIPTNRSGPDCIKTTTTFSTEPSAITSE